MKQSMRCAGCCTRRPRALLFLVARLHDRRGRSRMRASSAGSIVQEQTFSCSPSAPSLSHRILTSRKQSTPPDINCQFSSSVASAFCPPTHSL